MSLNRSSSNRSLSKVIDSEVGGGYASQPARSESLDDMPDDVQSVLYPETLPLAPTQKHSADFRNSRLKARKIAEPKLTQLADDLLKLADAVRYHHPLMAEALDEAWDATEAAITLMGS